MPILFALLSGAAAGCVAGYVCLARKRFTTELALRILKERAAR